MRNPYLIGNSVYLRPVEIGDAPLIQRWHNDPELRKLAGAPRLVSTLTAEEEDIKNASKSDDEVYLMECIDHVDACNDTVIALHKIVWLRISIGNKASWGKGYGSDAMRCVLEWLFREMNIHRVELETFATNKRALKFFEHIGFKREGIRREAHLADTRYYDIVCFGILKEEFYYEKG